MMMRMFKSDMLKMKRKWIWFLIFLGPFGVIALQGANYGLRYDYLISQYNNQWKGLMDNVQVFIPVTIFLGITIITSMMANIEHHQQSWKQLLSLPVRRSAVYSVKFILTFVMLLISCLLLSIGVIVLGITLDFGWGFPIGDILLLSLLPLFTAIPVLSFQLWLAIMFKNQVPALTIGISGAVFSMYAVDMPDWLIWKWPLLQDGHLEWYITLGVAIGLLIFAIGMYNFIKQDVK